MKTKTIYKTAGILAGILLLAVLFSSSAAAYELTADIPDVPSYTAGDIISVPVVLHGANEFLTFEAEVENNVPGIEITISDEKPVKSGQYFVNSKPENTVQKIAMYTITGITADEITLFIINVKITDPSVTAIPLTITLSQLGTEQEELPITDLPKITAVSKSITDSLKISVTGNDPVEPEHLTDILPTYVPTQPADIPVSQPSAEKEPAGQKTTTPGFGLIAVLGLGAAFAVSRKGFRK